MQLLFSSGIVSISSNLLLSFVSFLFIFLLEALLGTCSSAKQTPRALATQAAPLLDLGLLCSSSHQWGQVRMATGAGKDGH